MAFPRPPRPPPHPGRTAQPYGPAGSGGIRWDPGVPHPAVPRERRRPEEAGAPAGRGQASTCRSRRRGGASERSRGSPPPRPLLPPYFLFAAADPGSLPGPGSRRRPRVSQRLPPCRAPPPAAADPASGSRARSERRPRTAEAAGRPRGPRCPALGGAAHRRGCRLARPWGPQGARRGAEPGRSDASVKFASLSDRPLSRRCALGRGIPARCPPPPPPITSGSAEALGPVACSHSGPIGAHGGPVLLWQPIGGCR